MRAFVVLLALLLPLAAVGCASTAARPVTCSPLPLEKGKGSGHWERWRTQMWTIPDRARHAVYDVLTTPDSPFRVAGVMAYDVPASTKSLGDETVCVYLKRQGGAWGLLQPRTTDEDGRFQVSIPAGLPLGTHDMLVQVPGDASGVTARVYVRPPRTVVAVFDIDGTLTKSDKESLEKLAHEEFPALQPDADSLTRVVHGKCYMLLYLTARASPYLNTTREWLGKNHFAPGALVMAEDKNPLHLMTAEKQVKLKTEILATLASLGFVIAKGFGNRPGDRDAYAAVHARDYIIDPSGKIREWKSVIAELEKEPEVTQPGGQRCPMPDLPAPVWSGSGASTDPSGMK